MDIVVDEKGRVVDITLVSPLEPGLDKQARLTVEQWEFLPGMEAGEPVSTPARVAVNFRLPEFRFDEETERRRTQFNVALADLKGAKTKPKAKENAVELMRTLSDEKYPPAMELFGRWKIGGEYGPRDVKAGIALLQRAAKKGYGPALYEVALRRIEGRDLKAEIGKGLTEMRESAAKGTWQAQYYMGEACERGDNVAKNPGEARRYFELCAAQGYAQCRYRLGRLLFESAARTEMEYLRAVALFELASDEIPEAREIALREALKLTSGQILAVSTLKKQASGQ